MSSLLTRRRAAWAAPILAGVVVVAAAVLPTTASADPHPNLPDRTPAQLLVDVSASTVTSLSGTVVQTSRLGLPDLPGAGNSAALSIANLVTGTHTAKVWLDGPDRQRVALLGQLAESDVVHNGTDLWTYASDTHAVTHVTLPARGAGEKAAPVTGADLTPQAAAAKALAAIDPSTAVTVDRTERVAGRAAYTLVLTPRDARSTVRRVTIAVDAENAAPLRVQVFGAAAAPAFETAFTDVSFAVPASSVFAFTPPAGAVVTERSPAQALAPGTEGGRDQGEAAPDAASKSGDAPESTDGTAAPTVLGSGWASVLAVPAAAGGSDPLAAVGGGLVERLTTTLPNGDRLLRSSLLNALVTQDGRIFVGAVGADLLQQAAAGTYR